MLSGNLKYYLLIIFTAALFFIPFLGGVHLFDWDEVNFAEIAREMMLTNNYLQVQINFEPFYQKPPFFFWLQVLSMKMFGVNEFAARFPNAITGIITLIVLFKIGSKLEGKRFGLIWALTYFGSILPHFYFRTGIIDPVFNLLIFLGLYFFIKFKWKVEGFSDKLQSGGAWPTLIIGGFLLGLAILTKGPVAYLLVAVTFGVYWISKRFPFNIQIPGFIVFSFVAVAAMAIWFGVETLKNGPEFVKEFVIYQIRLLQTEDAGHAGFPGYHFVAMLFGCFPVSIFAIRAMGKMKIQNSIQKDFRRWMLILFWVVIGVFTLVNTKILHYSSMAYFPLSYLGAIVIYKIIQKEIALKKWMVTMLWITGILIASTTFILPYIGNHIELIKPLFEKDVHAYATLDADVNWTGWEALTGVVLLTAIALFVFLAKREKPMQAFVSLFYGTALFVFIGLIFFIARIELYTQNSLVEFAESIQGKPGYVHSSGFKSFVHYFYSRRQPADADPPATSRQMIYEEVEKDVYVFGKKNVEKYWKDREGFMELGDKNGYIFYKRENQNN